MPSSGELDASISEASAAVPSSGELDASISEASAAVPSSGEQAASILRRSPNPLLGKRPALVPSVYRNDSKTANGASLNPSGCISNRFQCPKCHRWYRFMNPQTFNANKARHMKACKGQNVPSVGLAEVKRKANKPKDVVAKARHMSVRKHRIGPFAGLAGGKRKARGMNTCKARNDLSCEMAEVERNFSTHEDAMAKPMRVKRSAQVVQASKSNVSMGSKVARAPDKPNLMSVASSILEFSQKAHQSSVSDSSAAMDLPAHIEESVASFRTDIYTTEQENENCESIARKFGLDARKIFILNHKRYRGFKSENTKLKAGTLLLLKGCHGNIEKTELDSKAKRRKR